MLVLVMKVYLLFHGVRHQLLLSALGADDVLPVRDEALADHAALAAGADEAVVVPVTTLKWDESSSSDTYFSFGALVLTFRKNFVNVKNCIDQRILILFLMTSVYDYTFGRAKKMKIEKQSHSNSENLEKKQNKQLTTFSCLHGHFSKISR